MQEFSEAANPGKHIAEMFPFLAKLPTWMQWWRKAALQSFNRQAAIWMKYWTQLKEQMALNSAPECFVKQFIETDYEKNGISELQAAFVAGSTLFFISVVCDFSHHLTKFNCQIPAMIEAGSETTSSALNSCIRYLAAYPEAQAKAYEEVRRVIGENRVPNFDDEENLPYIRACVKETLRIRPVTK